MPFSKSAMVVAETPALLASSALLQSNPALAILHCPGVNDTTIHSAVTFQISARRLVKITNVGAIESPACQSAWSRDPRSWCSRDTVADLSRSAVVILIATAKPPTLLSIITAALGYAELAAALPSGLRSSFGSSSAGRHAPVGSR